MATGNAVWGIDIGQCALKAIKLRPAEQGLVEAVAFDVIDHPKLLSQPDAEPDELISSALEKFASRNDWQGDQFVVGVPGQQTFARFCAMPPIDLKKDAKKIHDLVRYEASQQIPFDMDDVVWDYQVFTSEGTPDVEVGIFAIRKDLIRKNLGYYAKVGISPVGVQAIPAALYNFAQYDGQIIEEGGAIVLVDVGAQNTDLIIVEPNSAWTRNIPLGGNSFTEALVRSFKLSFAKAESLKRSAAESKYARQIFQAMRPVFADLVAEIQRSLGFFSSTHRDVELKRVMALGNAFRLPGLQKYLENNLTVAGGVVKLEKFGRLAPTATINAPQFTENILSFGAAYGLALQGLGLAKIRASLLPPELARIAVWRKKRPYFMATAASLLVAAAVPWVANALDTTALESHSAREAHRAAMAILDEAKRYDTAYTQANKDTTQQKQDLENLLKLQEKKLVLPSLLALVHEAMPPLNPPELAQVKSAAELKKLIEASPAQYDRIKRGQLILDALKIEYTSDLGSVDLASAAAQSTPGSATPTAEVGVSMPIGPMTGPPMGRGRYQAPQAPIPTAPGTGGAAPAEVAKEPGFVVRVTGRLLFGRNRGDAQSWFDATYVSNLRALSRQPGLGFYIPDDDAKDAAKKVVVGPAPMPYYDPAAVAAARIGPGGVPEKKTGVEVPDPLTGEEAKWDWKVQFAFKVKLGKMPEPEPAAPKK